MQRFFNTDKGSVIVIAFFSLCYFLGIGQFHLFDWDEINFAECAREMIVSGNYTLVQMDFLPFWEKPPFFFWLQVMAMKAFGITEFAARFPNAVFGGITLFTLFYIGKKQFSRQMGFLWAMLYAGSLLPHFYFKSGIIDPVFNYFIFLGIYQFISFLHTSEKQNQKALLSGLFIGIAVLTKGPVGLLLFLLPVGVYFLLKRFKNLPSLKHISMFLVMVLAVVLAWWSFDIAQNGFTNLNDFIVYQIRLFSTPDAGHQQPWFYHFLVVLIGCFPLSIFALPSLFSKQEDVNEMGLWMKILLWVVLVLFTIVTTKIIHYSSMAYLPLSYIAARSLYTQGIKKWTVYVYLVLGSIWGIAITAVGKLLSNKEVMADLLAKDAFAKASFMQDVVWNGTEFIGGALFLIAVIVAFVFLLKGKMIPALSVHALGFTVMFVFLAFAVLPKIEQYVQGPAIAFYKEAQGKDVYLNVAGYKSYGRAFYSKVQPIAHPKKLDNEWLVNGEDVDKTVMLVTKITDTRYDAHPNLVLQNQKGGFKLFVRAKQ